MQQDLSVKFSPLNVKNIQEHSLKKTVSVVVEQSGSPFPTRGLIILVTRRPELSAILNCATFDPNGLEPPF